MNNDKLKIVSPESTNDSNLQELRIIDNGENSYLACNNLIVTEKTNAADRPIHCSELNKELEHRNWHKHDLKFLGTDGKLYSCVFLDREGCKPEGIISSVWTNPNEPGFPATAIKCGDINITEQEINNVYDLYEKLFGAMKEKEISLYSIPKRVINIINGSVVFDLIRYNSTEYTDTISLGEVMRLPLAPVEFGRVDLGVQYSKSGNSGSDPSRVYNGDASFTAFSFEDNVRITNNVVGSINDEIKYEFLDGVLKVTPTTRDIHECIISYCTITYGRD